MSICLNQTAASLCDALIADAESLRIGVTHTSCGTRIIDCGIECPGGIEAGRRLAEICMSGLARVSLVPASSELCSGPAICVVTDQPLAACMASQYAGWQIAEGKFFAMGSGPMRALGSREPLFDVLAMRETAEIGVGVLETRTLPPTAICEKIAEQCRIAPNNLTLLVAPTATLAGTVQVVARSLETALHKLFELGFDLKCVVSGFGTAPLPPVAKDDLAAIGRTNDAILYGGEVTIWLRTDDSTIESIGPRVPSTASSDFGQPFAAIFERYGRDFYKIDPHLFSPASVTLCNLNTGRSYRFGQLHPRVIHESFGIRRL